MAQASEKKFPLTAEDYKLCEQVGEGVSATVYKALCVPLNEIVAIKVLDLEKCNNDLDGIRREVQTMVLIDHPNVLRAHCSFTTGHYLWVVMPYMTGGSCLHIMKSAYPEGFDEAVIAILLHEVLKALVYLHAHGHIHRDVKAGNILIDAKGVVKLSDFGVAACMFDSGDRQRSRNTFVGTPCWMAPEVMQELHGYDFKADIWSLGITALELAHGHAPFSKYPPIKVLLMTLQNAPPGLDYERDKKFSKSFKEMVAACLVKDPKKRPTSEKLLKHSFFKNVLSHDHLSHTILDGTSSLGERFRMLKTNKADVIVQNKTLYENKEQLSQQEYIRGISAWNFNLEDSKNQTALVINLIQEDAISYSVDSRVTEKHVERQDAADFLIETKSPQWSNQSNTVFPLEDGIDDIHNLDNSLAAFPIKPLQALKGCFDVCDYDIGVGSSSSRDSVHSDSEMQSQQELSSAADQKSGRDEGYDMVRSGSLSHSKSIGPKKSSSCMLMQDDVSSPKKFVLNGDRVHLQPSYQNERNRSGPLLCHQKKHVSNSVTVSGEVAAEGRVIEHKGRFKVTAADASPKGHMNSINQFSGVSPSTSVPTLIASSVVLSLQYILQQNTMQREEIIKLMKFVEQTSVNATENTEAIMNDLLQTVPTSVREQELQAQMFQMQQSIGSIIEELQRLKIKNNQLERRLIFLSKKDDKIRE